MFELYTWIAPECDFELLREVPVEFVAAHYTRAYKSGRHRRSPPFPLPTNSLEPTWVEARIPLKHLYYLRGEQASAERVSLARFYALGNRELPAGTAYYGKSRQQHARSTHTIPRAAVSDGNHRALAMEMRGGCSFRVFMAKSEYEALRRDAK
jgi:hypothetical protein